MGGGGGGGGTWIQKWVSDGYLCMHVYIVHTYTYIAYFRCGSCACGTQRHIHENHSVFLCFPFGQGDKGMILI